MLKKSGNKTSRELYMEFQKKRHDEGFISFAMKVMEELAAAGKPVAYHYHAAIGNFLRFTKGREVPFEKLTTRLIVRYDKWLNKEGVIRSTATTYLHTLQTIYNKALKNGIIEGNGKGPFGGVIKTRKEEEHVSNSAKKTGKKRKKAITQDGLWNKKWKAYMRYMEKNKARPSKRKAEDMVLFDWFKHSRKLMKRGLMKPGRIEKFQQLIDQIERLRQDKTKLNKRLSKTKDSKAVGSQKKDGTFHLYDYQ